MASDRLATIPAGLLSLVLFLPGTGGLAAQGGSWALTGPAPSSRTAGEVEVTVQPRRVELGEAAELSVTVPGRAAAAPEVPRVDGLSFVQRGRSTRSTIRNGVREDSVTWLYEVDPQRTGTFTIPAVTAVVGGSRLAGTPVQLDVVSPRPGAAKPTGPAGGSSPAQRRVDAAAGGAFLRVVPDAIDTVVGQRVPIEIKAYFPEGVHGTLDRLPALTSTEFTLEKISEEAQRSRERVGGETYTVLTWRSAVAPLKAGDYPLAADLDATLVLPRASRPARARAGFRKSPFADLLGDDPFGDDIFSSFFDRGRERQVTLRSDAPETLRVRPLPAAGRPADFTGAVGRFEVAAEARQHHVAEGDPITLDVTVRGRGNFDRVGAPALVSTRDFKVYPGKSEFRSGDGDTGYEGEKTFVITVVPKNADVTEIPPLQLSFFDDERGAYETVHSDAIPVEVDSAPVAAAGSSRPSPAGGAPAGKATERAATELAAPAPIPNRVAPGVTTPRGAAAWTRARLWGLSALALCAMAIGWAVDRRRRWLLDHPDHRRARDQRRALQAALLDVDAAMRSEQSGAFADGCRRVIDAARAAGGPLSPEVVQPILAMADSVSFGERPLSAEDMPRWRDRLRAAVGTEVRR